MKPNLILASCLLLASMAGGCNDDGSPITPAEDGGGGGMNGELRGRLVTPLHGENAELLALDLSTGRFASFPGSAEGLHASGMANSRLEFAIERDPSDSAAVIGTAEDCNPPSDDVCVFMMSDGGRIESLFIARGLGFSIASAGRSPDGRLVVLGEPGNGTLHLYTSSGQYVSGLNRTSADGSYDWLPDGRLLLGEGSRESPVLTVTEPGSLDPSERITLPASYEGYIRELSVSPSGNQAAMVFNPGGVMNNFLLVMNLETLRVYEPLASQSADGVGVVPGDISWSPDGRWLYLHRAYPNSGLLPTTGDLAVIGELGVIRGPNHYALRMDGVTQVLPALADGSGGSEGVRVIQAEPREQPGGPVGPTNGVRGLPYIWLE